MINFKKELEKLDITNTQIDKLEQYCKLIQSFNPSLSLVNTDIKDFIEYHIKDILQIRPYIELIKGSKAIDVGTGPGLPSIPLSIIYEDIVFYGSERMQKRVKFLNMAKALCKLDNFKIMDKEDLEIKDKFDYYFARAFSNNERLKQSIDALLKDDGVAYLYKGKISQVKEEVKVFQSDYIDDILSLNPINEAKRSLLILRRKIND